MVNATSSIFEITTTASGAPSWGGTVIYVALFIALPVATMAIGITVLWSVASYTRFKKYLDGFVNSFKYAFIGLITCLVLALPMGLLYYGYAQAKVGNTVPLKYGVYIIVGYIVLAIIGKLVHKYVIKRIETFENELHPDKKWSIFGSEEEEGEKLK